MSQPPAIVKGLKRPDAYDHSVSTIDFIETHISWLFLTGRYVYKIKKPVNFGFLDYSTLEKRKYYCHEELRLNKRYAEDIYLDVVPINQTGNALTVNGVGTTVEYAVKMRQFSVGQTLDRLAESSALTRKIADELATILVDFHFSIAQGEIDSTFGSPDRIQYWLNENFSQLYSLPVSRDLPGLTELKDWCDREFKKLHPALQSRRENGYIRECHGDLHLGNLVLIDNHVRIFDGIEFNPELRWIDVMNDLAFLIIDLRIQNYEELAFRVLNHYLQQTGDYSGLPLLGYYQVYRCLVRAKVTALRAQQLQDGGEGYETSLRQCASYLSLASDLSSPQLPLLIITHGYSGSGKSTYASRLAEIIGAIHLRSDRERKRLFGLAEHDKSNSSTNAGIYQKTVTERVYNTLVDVAITVLNSDLPVIVDATFLNRDQRNTFRVLADQRAIPFVILDFQAPEAVLKQRIEKRQTYENDASEATVDVMHHQIQNAESFLQNELDNVIEIDTTQSKVLEHVVKRIHDKINTTHHVEKDYG